VRIGQDVVKLRAHRRQHLRLPQLQVEFGIGLADCVVVGVILPRAEAPSVVFAHGHHRVAIAVIARKVGQRH
jgi:hypothetical protein